MSAASFHSLVGRALSDPQFREQLMASGDDQKAALRAVGLGDDDESVARLNEAIKAVDSLASLLSKEAVAS